MRLHMFNSMALTMITSKKPSKPYFTFNSPKYKEDGSWQVVHSLLDLLETA